MERDFHVRKILEGLESRYRPLPATEPRWAKEAYDLLTSNDCQGPKWGNFEDCGRVFQGIRVERELNE